MTDTCTANKVGQNGFIAALLNKARENTKKVWFEPRKIEASRNEACKLGLIKYRKWW